MTDETQQRCTVALSAGETCDRPAVEVWGESAWLGATLGVCADHRGFAPRDGRCEFDTGSALGNVRVCKLPATHTVRDGEFGGTHGQFCRGHARLSRYVMFGYRSDVRYALVTVEALGAWVSS